MGFLDFFGGGTPPKYISNRGAFDQFGNEMDQAATRYGGYVDSGNQARNLSMDEYTKLIQNPNFLQDMISKGFSESPYQNYITDQTQKRMNMNAANTGMLGSGAANRALSGEINNMTGQFMNDYINRGINSYGQGLSGLQGMTQLGFNALGSQDSLMEQAAAARLKGTMSDNETNQMNAQAEYDARNRGLGNLMGLAGSILGGPIGSKVGGWLSGSSGGSSGGGSGGGGFFSSIFGGGGGGGVRPGLQYSQQNAGQFPTPFSGGGTYNIGNWSY